ncbi:hypothetical protein POSPLADRAFT_1097494, partial [Postia placenta MAD-698-R-SB12]
QRTTSFPIMLARRLPVVERLHILDGSFHKITLPSLFHPCLLEFESVTILQPTNIAFASVDSFIGMVLALPGPRELEFRDAHWSQHAIE